MHLWEIDHPYYCSESNFTARDRRVDFASWAEFTTGGWVDNDPDLNLLFRWDWVSPSREPDTDLRADEPDKLWLFFMLQRKGDFWVMSVTLTDEDEPAVRAWLAERAKTIVAIWEPLLTEPGERP